MKSAKIFARIAASLLSLALLASASFAATNPLNYPLGLAVDSKGDLWVANQNGNNILAFSSAYALQKSKTITEGINSPTGVAFDPLGNLWVANHNASSITEYAGAGHNESAVITSAVSFPTAIAVDGLGNVWIVNSNQYVEVYAPSQLYGPPNDNIRSLYPGPAFYGIAVSDGEFVWGDGTDLSFAPAIAALDAGSLAGIAIGGSNTATYVASAANGNIYFTTTGNAVNYSVPAVGGAVTPLIQLSFAPGGLAVDSVHGRIYISNPNSNSIAVYSLTGTLLNTIE